MTAVELRGCDVSARQGISHLHTPLADLPWSISRQQVEQCHRCQQDRLWKRLAERACRRRTVRYWHPLGCRAIEPGKTAPGGGWCDVHRHTPHYGFYITLRRMYMHPSWTGTKYHGVTAVGLRGCDNIHQGV